MIVFSGVNELDTLLERSDIATGMCHGKWTRLLGDTKCIPVHHLPGPRDFSRPLKEMDNGHKRHRRVLVALGAAGALLQV